MKSAELQREARRLVDENGTKIADVLFRAAEQGDLMSTKLLLWLANAGVDIERVFDKKPLKTIAMRLAAERQLPRDYPDVEREQDSPQTGVLTV